MLATEDVQFTPSGAPTKKSLVIEFLESPSANAIVTAFIKAYGSEICVVGIGNV